MSSKTALVIFYLVLSLVAAIRLLGLSDPKLIKDGIRIKEKVRISSAITYKEKYNSFYILLGGNKVRVIVDRFKDVDYGQLLYLSGSVKNTVLDNGKTVSSIYFPKVTPVKDENIIFVVAGIIRGKVREAFNLYLPPDEASLLVGIVFGINDGFSTKVSDSFRITGVMHVIAASGMNVALLGGFAANLFQRFFKRRTALVVSILTVLFYAVLSGLQPSIVRATIMGCLLFISMILGRQALGKLALIFTGLVMLIVSPALIIDVGFQLSFMATVGIMWLKDIFNPLTKDRPAFEDFATTLAAQLGTLPILFYYFGSVGVLSPLVNGIVLWIIPAVMIVGLIAAVIALLSLPIAGAIAYLTLPLLSYFLLVTTHLATISPVLKLTITPLVVCIYYLVILFVILLKRRRENRAV